jgi:hypothetical protein
VPLRKQANQQAIYHVMLTHNHLFHFHGNQLHERAFSFYHLVNLFDVCHDMLFSGREGNPMKVNSNNGITEQVLKSVKRDFATITLL